MFCETLAEVSELSQLTEHAWTQLRWIKRAKQQRAMAEIMDDPLEEFVSLAQSLPETGGPWGLADVDSPLAESRLKTLMELHESRGGAGQTRSFVKTYATSWQKRTGCGVGTTGEFPRVLTSKKSCSEVVTHGCLRDHQRDAPAYPSVRSILECLLAPAGQDMQPEQMMLRVSTERQSITVLSLNKLHEINPDLSHSYVAFCPKSFRTRLWVFQARLQTKR